MRPAGVSSPEIRASLLTFASHLQLLVELDRLFFSAIEGREGGGETALHHPIFIRRAHKSTSGTNNTFRSFRGRRWTAAGLRCSPWDRALFTARGRDTAHFNLAVSNISQLQGISTHQLFYYTQVNISSKGLLHSQLLHLISLAASIGAPLKLDYLRVQSQDLVVQVVHLCHLRGKAGMCCAGDFRGFFKK